MCIIFNCNTVTRNASCVCGGDKKIAGMLFEGKPAIGVMFRDYKRLEVLLAGLDVRVLLHL